MHWENTEIQFTKNTPAAELLQIHIMQKEHKSKEVPEQYDVTQPSVYNVIGHKGIKRATVIEKYAYTITTRQDRTPAQVIDKGNGKYRYLTERECWRLMGYTDEEYERAAEVQQRRGRYKMALYKQAGNSIAVPVLESIFKRIITEMSEETIWNTTNH